MSLTPEEWLRTVASWEEDARIAEATITEVFEDAAMLRERGHDFPAEVMEHHARKAQEIIDDARADLQKAVDGD